MVVEFECRRCGLVVSFEQYQSDRFCPNDGTLLRLKIVKINPTNSGKEQKPMEIYRADINLDALWFRYMQDLPVQVVDGIEFETVDSWVMARKRAYTEFRKSLSPDALYDVDRVQKIFKDWLLFKNNLSWTTFQRTGYQALENPEGLAKLLRLLQNEKLNVAERVRKGLIGENKVRGIGQGILTALLHTFFDEKYGVWNSRTADTLRILRRPPKTSSDVGTTYLDVNSKLHELSKELDTGLTSIDGFMWFISKRVKFI
jgi:hypothetical protein